MMVSAKQEVSLLEGGSLEDVRYHLYVIAKVRIGLERADSEGAIEQDQAEARLAKWIIE